MCLDQYNFDKDNRLTAEDSTANMDVSYKYDAQGNVSEKDYKNGLVEKFSYNAEGQLIQVQSNVGKTVTYSYDGFGNRTQKIEKTTIEQSEGSSFLSFLKDDKSYNEDYDQKLVSQTTGEQIDNLRQTISDHLETYNQTCPVDDEDGSKTSSTTLNYVNDINQEYTQVLQVQTANYQPLNTYVYGVQRISKEYAVTGASSASKHDANTFYQYDGRGSVIGQNKADTPEKLAFQIKYDDFGQTNRKTDNEFGYNAEVHDYNSTQYLRARYYDTGTGRFNQQDSYLGTQEETVSQNRYAYANNNPANNIDPSGHSSLGSGIASGAIKFNQKVNEYLGMMNRYQGVSREYAEWEVSRAQKNSSDKALAAYALQIYNKYKNNPPSKAGYVNNPGGPNYAGDDDKLYDSKDDYVRQQNAKTPTQLAEEERDRDIEALLRLGGQLPPGFYNLPLEEQVKLARKIRQQCEESAYKHVSSDEMKAKAESLKPEPVDFGSLVFDITYRLLSVLDIFLAFVPVIGSVLSIITSIMGLIKEGIGWMGENLVGLFTGIAGFIVDVGLILISGGTSILAKFGKFLLTAAIDAGGILKKISIAIALMDELLETISVIT